MIVERDFGETKRMEILYRREKKKPKRAHTLTQRELAILNAKPTEAPDKAKVKWPKTKKWQLYGKRTAFIPKGSQRPDMRPIREVLQKLGRNLKVCEVCGVRSRKLQIHHKDRNPFNNIPSNLLIICRRCHGKIHFVDEDIMNIKDQDYALGVIEEDV